jgi:hypothetical protein
MRFDGMAAVFSGRHSEQWIACGLRHFPGDARLKSGLRIELDTLDKSTEPDEFTSAAEVLEVFLEQRFACTV